MTDVPTRLQKLTNLTREVTTLKKNQNVNDNSNTAADGEIARTPPIKDSSSILLSPLVFGYITAANFHQYDIDWTKFDTASYLNERLEEPRLEKFMDQIETFKFKEWQHYSSTCNIDFLKWYLSFESKMRLLNMATFLFDEKFDSKERNPLEVIESKFICYNILLSLFPKYYGEIPSDCSKLFDKIIYRYLPGQKYELARDLVEELTISPTSDIDLIIQTYKMGNALRKLGDLELINEQDFCHTVMIKASFEVT